MDLITSASLFDLYPGKDCYWLGIRGYQCHGVQHRETSLIETPNCGRFSLEQIILTTVYRESGSETQIVRSNAKYRESGFIKTALG